MPRAASGRLLQHSFFADMPAVTLGLVRAQGSSLCFGPIELLRFGRARVTRTRVEWPIEGGLAARRAGGIFAIESAGGRMTTSVDGYRPLLPRAIYLVTQLPIHHLVTRLHLLRVRGREPAPGVRADPASRFQAAAIDVALCVTLARLSERRPSWRFLLGVAASYHVACWSISGRTLGGLVMRQRVVAADGSRPSVGQAILRLLALPLAALRRRPEHDAVAGTDVVDG